MDVELLIIIALTFVIHLIGTLSYSARIAGTRTGKIAISFALFNIMLLISRTSNSFQGPLLGKRIEENLGKGILNSIETDFRVIILSATVATVIGFIALPSFQRLFTNAIQRVSEYKSIPNLIFHSFTPSGIILIKNSVVLPSINSITHLNYRTSIPIKFFIFNVLAIAVWTIGVLSSLYAGYLDPELRVTSSQLSSVVNGVATILMFVFIDPYLAMITDETSQGKHSQSYFRNIIVILLISRLLGTMLAQVLFLPAANLIVSIAKVL